MISAFANTWRVPELRDRIIFTLVMIVIVRLGVNISLPGVDSTVIKEWLEIRANEEGTGAGAHLGALLNVFSGGALQNAALFALGIMPYISASIMMQLMAAVVPKLAKLRREEGGQQKINQYTRIMTIIIAAVQGFLLAKSLENPEAIIYMDGIEKVGRPLVPDWGWGFVCMAVLTIIAGTMFLMWIGDQITERGIGNGISLIISVNIIAALPGGLTQAWTRFIGTDGSSSPFQAMTLVGLVAFLLLITAAIIAITQAQRRIAVQYAKRASNRSAKQMTGHTQYLPLKVNYAGVMPIIFASAVLNLPLLLLSQIFPDAAWVATFQQFFNTGAWPYYVIAGIMIFFFSYFWVATMFQPSEISENLKKGGGYIPGVRPGKPTADFLDFTMTRLTFAGAIFLTIIFVLPGLVTHIFQLPGLVSQFFGGTSLLILVGVLLDMMRQIETHLLQRNYDGFLRKGKLKGRIERRQASGQSANGGLILWLLVFVSVMIVLGIAAWIAK
ncbi:preprotein translocase subunit SecY [Roseibacillus persicicus]|uniref:Protein translocase subunit SecY n=1 Tax=Roseibacillus persicicus TaxID=454148 RepID=A0A918TER6_9BACT|nr:preprotein translocase subunit SecY [Roseibacillus persicicus]MDQ8191856.1 preprotein translocase subunit SecY [Roseibacillus persicicus]GHC44931.1 protein translocase subunit SecY [Roseibacillus persicicus]